MARGHSRCSGHGRFLVVLLGMSILGACSRWVASQPASVRLEDVVARAGDARERAVMLDSLFDLAETLGLRSEGPRTVDPSRRFRVVGCRPFSLDDCAWHTVATTKRADSLRESFAERGWDVWVDPLPVWIPEDDAASNPRIVELPPLRFARAVLTELTFHAPDLPADPPFRYAFARAVGTRATDRWLQDPRWAEHETDQDWEFGGRHLVRLAMASLAERLRGVYADRGTPEAMQAAKQEVLSHLPTYEPAFDALPSAELNALGDPSQWNNARIVPYLTDLDVAGQVRAYLEQPGNELEALVRVVRAFPADAEPIDALQAAVAQLTAAERAEAARMVKAWARPYVMARGREVYEAYCATCHGASGEGREGRHPPLVHVTDKPRTYAIQVVLEGLSGPTDVGGRAYDGAMAPHGFLTDIDVAAAVSFVWTTFGRGEALTTPADVDAVRGRQ